MRKIILSVQMALIAMTITAQNYSTKKDHKEFFNHAVRTLHEFKKTSPFIFRNPDPVPENTGE